MDLKFYSYLLKTSLPTLPSDSQTVIKASPSHPKLLTTAQTQLALSHSENYISPRNFLPLTLPGTLLFLRDSAQISFYCEAKLFLPIESSHNTIIYLTRWWKIFSSLVCKVLDCLRTGTFLINLSISSNKYNSSMQWVPKGPVNFEHLCHVNHGLTWWHALLKKW